MEEVEGLLGLSGVRCLLKSTYAVAASIVCGALGAAVTRSRGVHICVGCGGEDVAGKQSAADALVFGTQDNLRD
eukprot:363256-Chlamydomonas_euryale.AAC.6